MRLHESIGFILTCKALRWQVCNLRVPELARVKHPIVHFDMNFLLVPFLCKINTHTSHTL